MTPDDPRHGTTNGYGNLGCRCEPCTAAWRDYYREYTHRSARAIPREDYIAISRMNLVHGTERGSRRGCRCDACRLAAAVARWERRQAGRVATHNRSGYANGCRCEICREGQRLYQAERRARARALA